MKIRNVSLQAKSLSTCHSNLSDEKLPVYFKAKKMNFPTKPECLNFTPLEET